ncbi:DUF3883 domain-containing protein [Cryobacterium cheniae]|uniref:DUF3883 domain-containing protein n=1 Tax=Cryobacterium cheniae TaxID=1259262 RepID=A0A4R8XS63_9MICO|nr:DUF3883 domain-containing protein [Cryobacterium cheniae]TFC81154.1 DUF3883 domain-containing protein [Cryobacterium cheniae]
MAIKAWWDGQLSQRYWMEITDRPDLGGELTAPQYNIALKPEWSYELVTHVRPGDIVIHWHKKLVGEPAIVGWSRAVGPLSESTMSWTSPGAKDSARHHVDVPNWIMPLGALHLLDAPITSADLQSIFPQIVSTLEGFSYAPFYVYGGRQLRAMQSYLTKFPAELIPVIESVGSLELDAEPNDFPLLPDTKTTPNGHGGGQGWLRDAKLKVAIELHAVQKAVEHYVELGATDILELGKPFDIKLMLGGDERRIEVKGSSGAVDSVLLTRNEVIHARGFESMDLVVVDEIEFERLSNGEYATKGGRIRVWNGWSPSEQSLTAMSYKHELSPSALGNGIPC